MTESDIAFERRLSASDEGEDIQSKRQSTEEPVSHRTLGPPWSPSLPGSERTDFLDSSPPRRGPSVSSEYDSDGVTILVRETPLFGQSSRSGRQARFPQRSSEGHLTERMCLRATMLDLREQLRASTGIIDNLRTRNQVWELERTAREAELKKLQDERKWAWEMAVEVSASEKVKTQSLLKVLGVVSLGIVIYCYWCWYFGPEMLYIRQRRRAVLFE